MKPLIKLGVFAPYIRKDTAKEMHFNPTKGKLTGSYSRPMLKSVAYPDGTTEELTSS